MYINFVKMICIFRIFCLIFPSDYDKVLRKYIYKNFVKMICIFRIFCLIFFQLLEGKGLTYVIVGCTSNLNVKLRLYSYSPHPTVYSSV